MDWDVSILSEILYISYWNCTIGKGCWHLVYDEDRVDIAPLTLTTTSQVHGLGWVSGYMRRKVGGKVRITFPVMVAPELELGDVDSMPMSLNS